MANPMKALLVVCALLIVLFGWVIGQPAGSVTPTLAQPIPTGTLATVQTPTVALPTVTLPTVTIPPVTATLPVATATIPTSIPTVVPTVPSDATATAVPTMTLTPGPTATPGAPAADLEVTVVDAPDVVPPGGHITYTVTVRNSGMGASPASTVISQLPGGTQLETAVPGCGPAPNGVACGVPPLSPGGTAAFTFSISAQGGPGTIVTTVLVDPANAIVESDEANNSASASTTVALLPGMPAPAFPPPFPPEFPGPGFPPGMPPMGQQPPAAIATPALPAPSGVVVPPADVAGVQVPPPQAQPGETWLQILAPTQTYSVDMDPLWVAMPGEWYIVTGTEGGWALAVWEGDTTGWSVWIPMDERVVAMTIDRADPRIGTEVWLVAFGPTQAYSAATMDLAWMTSPGEWYRVLQHDGEWALAVYETDPLSAAVWIRLGDAVQLAPSDAPHSPA